MTTSVLKRGVPAAVTGMTAGPLFVFVASQSSPLMAVGAVVGAVVAGTIVAWPVLGFMGTALVVPLERIGRFTNDSSMYTISLMRVMGMLTLAGLLLHAFLKRRPLLVPKPFVLYLLYTIVAGLSLAYTTDSLSSVRSLGAMIGNLLFLFLVINAVRRPEHARLAVILWLVSTVAIAGFTIYQWHNPSAVIVDDPLDATGERRTDDRFSTVLNDVSEFQILNTVPRAIGTTSAAAVYGINLILALPFFAYLWRTTAGWPRLLVVVGAALTAYNVFLTNTRAAVITLAVVTVLILATRLVRVSARGLILTAVLAGALLPFMPEALYTRIFDVSRYSLAGSDTLRVRFAYWEEGFNIFADNWLIGVGIGNQAELPKRLGTRMRMPPNSTVHNEYLQSLMETGVIGYSLLVAFMVCLFRRCRAAQKAFRGGDERDQSLAWLATASHVAFWIVLFYAVQVDVLHFPLKGWWLAMGLIVVLSERAFAERARLAPGEGLA